MASENGVMINEDWANLNYYKEEDLKSTSKNSPYLGLELQGKVLGSFNNGILTLNN